MSTLKAGAAVVLLATGLGLAGCASVPSLCERKARYLTTQCQGKLSVAPDPYCEQSIKNCGSGHLAQMEGYVACLEAADECSLDVMRNCQEKFPGGVNLSCS